MQNARRDFGPSIRIAINYVHRKNYKKYREEVLNAFEDLDIDQLETITQKGDKTGISDISSMLLWMSRNADNAITFRIPTKYLSHHWHIRLKVVRKQQRLRYLNLWNYNMAFKSAVGSCYEGEVHLHLVEEFNKYTWKIYQQDQPPTKEHSASEESLLKGWGSTPLPADNGYWSLPQPISTLLIPKPQDRKRLAKQLEVACRPVYLKPDFATYPTFDGAIIDGNNVYLLQMTISSKHRCTSSGIQQLIDVMPSTLIDPSETRWHMIYITPSHRDGSSLVKGWKRWVNRQSPKIGARSAKRSKGMLQDELSESELSPLEVGCAKDYSEALD